MTELRRLIAVFGDESACLHGIAAARTARLVVRHVFSPFATEQILERIWGDSDYERFRHLFRYL